MGAWRLSCNPSGTLALVKFKDCLAATCTIVHGKFELPPRGVGILLGQIDALDSHNKGGAHAHPDTSGLELMRGYEQMASFRIYNIQLLPLDNSRTPEVGVTGYKKLLEELELVRKAAHASKTLIENSYKLPHDTYFAAFTIFPRTKFAEGKWVKYQKAESVVDLYTNKSLFIAAEGDAPVSNTYLFRFLFDYEAHRLAVEELGGKLPSAGTLQKALINLLEPIAQSHFPEHTLTVNLVSESKALEQALEEAKGFRRVEVSLTFPNGHQLTKRLREMKENNVHVVKAEASSNKGALMPHLPDFILELVKASTDYGRSKFTYVKDKLQKRQVFSTEEHPEKIQLRQKKNEQEVSFMERVRQSLRSTAGLKTPAVGEQK